MQSNPALVNNFNGPNCTHVKKSLAIMNKPFIIENFFWNFFSVDSLHYNRIRLHMKVFQTFTTCFLIHKTSLKKTPYLESNVYWKK